MVELAILGAALILTAYMAKKGNGEVSGSMGYTATGPRGIRNNNPGNIEDNGTAWKGYIGNDGRYIIFEHVEYGIRAINRILDTYLTSYQLNTVAGIISRYAPVDENNTAAYIADVSARIGKGPDVELVEADRIPLIKAIVHHENGQQPYTDETITRGVNLQ